MIHLKKGIKCTCRIRQRRDGKEVHLHPVGAFLVPFLAVNNRICGGVQDDEAGSRYQDKQ